tara:strand:+ start:66087 stop:67265 length:1179 start_codon:yes stop_codon:yes gene_type:complete
MLFIIFTILFSSVAIAEFDYDKYSLPTDNNYAGKTFIFWLNGDSNRFRPEISGSKKQVRIDKVDAERITNYAQDCACNVILVHDQRGKDRFYNSSKHFGSYIKVWRNGTLLRFGRSNRLKAREVNQDAEFVESFLHFSKELFPNSEFYFTYRGHSFSHFSEMMPFDYSHPETRFEHADFIKAVSNSGINFKAIIFAACSMAQIDLALGLVDYADYMLASQVDIYESGDTGFNFNFLTTIKEDSSDESIIQEIYQSLLGNFKSVNNENAYLLETPTSLINLKELTFEKETLTLINGIISENYNNSPELFKACKVVKRISPRYFEELNKESSERAQLMQEYLIQHNASSELDLVCAMRKVNIDESYIQDLKRSISLLDPSPALDKDGVSLIPSL